MAIIRRRNLNLLFFFICSYFQLYNGLFFILSGFGNYFSIHGQLKRARKKNVRLLPFLSLFLSVPLHAHTLPSPTHKYIQTYRHTDIQTYRHTSLHGVPVPCAPREPPKLIRRCSLTSIVVALFVVHRGSLKIPGSVASWFSSS